MEMLRIILALLLFLEQSNNIASKEIKLIYEKDISEHCRRRVVPSMFLGRQVIDANARIMQFSRLELPYSCYISIRTESGSSIVMMIQVTSPDVQESCKNSEQLLVYEMGETFGGYWGPMPKTVIKREPVPPKVYTLKTTHYTTIPTNSTTEEEETETTQISTASSKRYRERTTGDFVEVEIPLLNVSVHYVPVKETQADISGLDTFDMHHDVTPIKGVAYDRSILPLVQFRLMEHQGGRRNDDGEPPKYDLDFLQDFTPDMRLTLPQLNPTSKRRYKQKYQATRRLSFKKHRTLFHSLRQPDRRVMSKSITRKINDVTKYYFPTRNITKNKPKYTQNSWRVIEDLIKKLNKNKARTLKTSTFSIKEATLLERMSNMDHNKSAYLSSNLSIYDTDNDVNKYISTNNAVLSTRNLISLNSNSTEEYSSKEPISKMKTAIKSTILIEDTIPNHNGYRIDEVSKSTESTTESSLTKDAHHVLSSAFETSRSTTQINAIFDQNNVSETQSNIPVQITVSSLNTESFVDSKNKLTTIVTGSMVGHESWENLVQAAPEMAVLLNQTVIADAISRANASDDITKETNDEHKNKMLKRKKRDVHSIAIENAQPHTLTTRKSQDTTTQLSFNVADMQEFAQLVELEDDELHGRVALRHLNQYVGPALFNLCSIHDPTKPHVHLFNSSRIVLSPTNFTFDRMVIILTAARALLSGELRCPRTKIECQVSGARVCLDSMVACDGVPNCGSYDIYDEDRLMCGHTASLQHNVYLAAFTFLAVLLTVIYAVHYWLKRCVTKVADAFFVYSDGVENILYLDSIMRSPHDMGEEPNLVYHSRMYEDNINDEDVTEYYKTACQRFLRKLFCCCRKTHHKMNEAETSQLNLNLSMSRKMYSFTELEIRKMIASSNDIAVQTGDSLEMRVLEYDKDNNTVPSTSKQAVRPTATSYDLSINVIDSLLTLEEPLPEEHTDELSLLKFLKAAAKTKRTNSIELRADSIQSAPNKSPPENKTRESHSRIDSQSEREIEIHTYDHHGASEPGPSERKMEVKRSSTGGKVPSSSSVSKNLRFDEITTTIPAGRYSDQDDDVVTNADGRRTVASRERGRHSSRPLDTIDEADEQGGSNKEHRHFWGSSKAKKPKKKAQVSLR